MSFYSQIQQQTVQIDGENTVTVRRLTYGESQAVVGESTVMDLRTQQGQIDFSRHQIARLIRAIVAWDGPGFEGRPVTRENIEALPVNVGNAIARAVSEINGELTEPERKN